MKSKMAPVIILTGSLVGVFWFVNHSFRIAPVEASAVPDELPQTKTNAVSPALGTSVDSIPPSVETEKIVESNEIRMTSGDEARLKKIEAGVELKDIPDALQFLQSLPDTEEIQLLLVALIRQWAEHDINAAVAWVEAMPSCPAKSMALQGVAIEFVNQDLMQSIQWAWKLPEGEDRDGVIQCLGYEAAITAPVAALTIAVGSLPATAERDDLIRYASLQWAAREPEKAAMWADQISDAVLRESVLGHVTTAWGESDPVRAAQFAIEKMPQGRAQEDALIGIIQRWVQKDPEAVTDWVETFPEGALFDIAAETIRKLWPVTTP